MWRRLFNIDRSLIGTIAILPFFTLWRLITPNDADRVFLRSDAADTIHPSLAHVLAVVKQGDFSVWNWHVYSGTFEGGAYYDTLLYPLLWKCLFTEQTMLSLV